MKRIAWIALVITILVGADGIYMVSSHYKASDVNNFKMSDGATVLVAAVLLLVITIISFIVAARKKQPTSERNV